MLRRRHVVIALTLLLAPSMTASAHEDDTHYVLTYVICRSVGFKHEEALCVAACDVAMDDWDNLVAAGSDLGGTSTFQGHVDNQWMWHAIAPADGLKKTLQSTSDILKQKNMLFQLALDKWLGLSFDADVVESWKLDPEQEKKSLFWLGVFFHYQQDTWAHRRVKMFNDKAFQPSVYTRKQWESYSSPNGHVGIMDGFDTIHEQDRPPWNPLGSLRNLEDGICYARTFLKTVLNRQPNQFFTNLQVGQGIERKDKDWPQRNMLFNQITLEATTDAGKYLEELIRAQIGVYTNKNTTTSAVWGKGSPATDRYHTADELKDIGKVLEAFATVWVKYKEKLKLDGDFPTSSTFPITKKQRDTYRLRIPVSWTSNDFVREMGGWQDVLGFPSKTVDRMDLIPTPPKPNRGLQNVTGPWHLASSEPPFESDRGTQTAIASLLDVSAMNPDKPTSYEILAVGSNRMLYRKSLYHGPWQLVPKSIGKYGVVAAKMLPNGTVLGVTSDFRLETKVSLDPKDEWKLIEDSSARVCDGPDGEARWDDRRRQAVRRPSGNSQIETRSEPIREVRAGPRKRRFE